VLLAARFSAVRAAVVTAAQEALFSANCRGLCAAPKIHPEQRQQQVMLVDQLSVVTAAATLPLASTCFVKQGCLEASFSRMQ
jgi:hypothetical protein